MPIATPNPDAGIIQTHMATCNHCKQPIASMRFSDDDEWSEWAHALSAKQECDTNDPGPIPETERAN